jgi:hypothetical protein
MPIWQAMGAYVSIKRQFEEVKGRYDPCATLTLAYEERLVGLAYSAGQFNSNIDKIKGRDTRGAFQGLETTIHRYVADHTDISQRN